MLRREPDTASERFGPCRRVSASYVSAAHRRARLVITVALDLCSIVHSWPVRRQTPWLRLRSRKDGRYDTPALYENWNSFSRVQVRGNPHELQGPVGWGFSPTTPEETRTRRTVRWSC